MSKRKTAVALKKTEDAEVTVSAFKAFDANFQCRGFQYELGKTYTIEGKVSLCQNGFHACLVPFDAIDYYPSFEKLALVKVTDPVGHRPEDGPNDSKIVTAKITIEAALTIPEFIKRQVSTVIDLCKLATGTLAKKKKECAAATGYSGHAAATGYSGHAAATGDRGHAAATGDSGHAAATGKHSVAASFGIEATAQGALGTWLTLAEWKLGKAEWELVEVKSAKIDGETLKANTPYRLIKGAFIEAELAA